MSLTKPMWISIATPATIGAINLRNNPCTAGVTHCSPIPEPVSLTSSFTTATPQVESIPMGRLPRAGFHVLDLTMMTDALLRGVKGLSIEHPDVIAKRYQGTNPSRVEGRTGGEGLKPVVAVMLDFA